MVWSDEYHVPVTGPEKVTVGAAGSQPSGPYVCNTLVPAPFHART